MKFICTPEMLMLMLFLFLFNTANAMNSQVVLSFDGAHCEICDTGVGNYACSNGLGFWNNGTIFFQNPIPDNNVLTNINVVLKGTWGCDNDSSTISLYLEDTFLATETKSGHCFCGQCDHEIEYDISDSFPQYRYGDELNKLQLVVDEGLACVTTVTVILEYEPGTSTTPPPSGHCNKFGGCGNHGICQYDFEIDEYRCMCDLDWHGPNCDCFVPSLHLQTDNPPVLDGERSGFEEKDMFVLYVNNSVKYYDTKLKIRNNLNGFCNFGQADIGIMWTRTYDPIDCVYTYKGTVPWQSPFPECFFTRFETDNFILLTAELLIENKEDLGPFSDTRPNRLVRTISSTIPFQIKFPKGINLTTDGDISVFAQLQVFAAIVEQTFETGTPSPGLGTIKLLTSVQWPFQLTAPLNVSGPEGYDLSIDGPWEDGGAACLDDGNECQQIWTVLNRPDTDKCNIDGNYTTYFKVKCKDSVQNCVIDDTNNDVQINFRLESEDFCPQITDEIDLLGSMDIYKDAAHNIRADAFFLGDTIYFKIVLASDKTSILRSILKKFTMSFTDGTIITLYNMGNTDSGNFVNLLVFNNIAPDEVHIELTVDSDVFKVPTDDCDNVRFWADIKVDFFDSLKIPTSKRQGDPGDSTDITLTNNPCIGRDPDNSDGSDGNDGDGDSNDGDSNDGDSNDGDGNDGSNSHRLIPNKAIHLLL